MSYDDRVTLTFLLYFCFRSLFWNLRGFYREDFRKQFKKDNPDNKAVSAVSICSCFYWLNIACIEWLFTKLYINFVGGQSCWSKMEVIVWSSMYCYIYLLVVICVYSNHYMLWLNVWSLNFIRRKHHMQQKQRKGRQNMRKPWRHITRNRCVKLLLL